MDFSIVFYSWYERFLQRDCGIGYGSQPITGNSARAFHCFGSDKPLCAGDATHATVSGTFAVTLVQGSAGRPDVLVAGTAGAAAVGVVIFLLSLVPVLVTPERF